MVIENKTDRIVDLIFWLLKTKEGISKDRIILEYKICKKTFKRDVLFLESLTYKNFYYNKKQKRLFVKESIL